MLFFDFDTARNEFGEKLIKALNSQIITKRTFPVGTVKSTSLHWTGWLDVEVRFSATSGADVSNREVRVRRRQHQTFFEVRYVDKTTNEFAPRFYARDEHKQALDDMEMFLAEGLISEAWTHGAVEYKCWLSGVTELHHVPVNDTPGIDEIIRADFRRGEAPVFQPKSPAMNYRAA